MLSHPGMLLFSFKNMNYFFLIKLLYHNYNLIKKNERFFLLSFMDAELNEIKSNVHSVLLYFHHKMKI